jgi:hypothetical protein
MVARLFTHLTNMECRNHPETGATGRCAGCAESFCENCLIELEGQYYCGACKVMALGGRTLIAERATTWSKEASSALTMAIIGLFFWGIILEPLAIITALKAKKQIAGNVQLTGSGKATAALIVASAGIALAVINLIALATKMG